MPDTEPTTTEPTVPDTISDTLIEALESLDGVASTEPGIVHADEDDVSDATDGVIEHSN